MWLCAAIRNSGTPDVFSGAFWRRRTGSTSTRTAWSDWLSRSRYRGISVAYASSVGDTG